MTDRVRVLYTRVDCVDSGCRLSTPVPVTLPLLNHPVHGINVAERPLSLAGMLDSYGCLHASQQLTGFLL